jgi:hypothetical protein
MRRHKIGLIVALVVSLAWIASACSASPSGTGASGANPGDILTPAVAGENLIDLGTIPASLPGAKIKESEAISIARQHAMGGPNAGSVRGTVRAMAQPDQSQAERTVWVVVFGPGGNVPVPAIAASEPPLLILYQLVLIDDQTGAFLRASVKSAP